MCVYNKIFVPFSFFSFFFFSKKEKKEKKKKKKEKKRGKKETDRNHQKKKRGKENFPYPARLDAPYQDKIYWKKKKGKKAKMVMTKENRIAKKLVQFKKV